MSESNGWLSCDTQYLPVPGNYLADTYTFYNGARNQQAGGQLRRSYCDECARPFTAVLANHRPYSSAHAGQQDLLLGKDLISIATNIKDSNRKLGICSSDQEENQQSFNRAVQACSR